MAADSSSPRRVMDVILRAVELLRLVVDTGTIRPIPRSARARRRRHRRAARRPDLALGVAARGALPRPGRPVLPPARGARAGAQHPGERCGGGVPALPGTTR